MSMTTPDTPETPETPDPLSNFQEPNKTHLKAKHEIYSKKDDVEPTPEPVCKPVENLVDGAAAGIDKMARDIIAQPLTYAEWEHLEKVIKSKTKEVPVPKLIPAVHRVIKVTPVVIVMAAIIAMLVFIMACQQGWILLDQGAM